MKNWIILLSMVFSIAGYASTPEVKFFDMKCDFPDASGAQLFIRYKGDLDLRTAEMSFELTDKKAGKKYLIDPQIVNVDYDSNAQQVTYLAKGFSMVVNHSRYVPVVSEENGYQSSSSSIDVAPSKPERKSTQHTGLLLTLGDLDIKTTAKIRGEVEMICSAYLD